MMIDGRYILQICDCCGHEWQAHRDNDGEACPACLRMHYVHCKAICVECGAQRLVWTKRDGERVWYEDKKEWHGYTNREEDRVRCVECNEWTCVLYEGSEPLQVRS